MVVSAWASSNAVLNNSASTPCLRSVMSRTVASSLGCPLRVRGLRQTSAGKRSPFLRWCSHSNRSLADEECSSDLLFRWVGEGVLVGLVWR